MSIQKENFKSKPKNVALKKRFFWVHAIIQAFKDNMLGFFDKIINLMKNIYSLLHYKHYKF